MIDLGGTCRGVPVAVGRDGSPSVHERRASAGGRVRQRPMSEGSMVCVETSDRRLSDGTAPLPPQVRRFLRLLATFDDALDVFSLDSLHPAGESAY
jgi:hypothetical protein